MVDKRNTTFVYVLHSLLYDGTMKILAMMVPMEINALSVYHEIYDT